MCKPILVFYKFKWPSTFVFRSLLKVQAEKNNIQHIVVGWLTSWSTIGYLLTKGISHLKFHIGRPLDNMYQKYKRTMLTPKWLEEKVSIWCDFPQKQAQIYSRAASAACGRTKHSHNTPHAGHHTGHTAVGRHLLLQTTWLRWSQTARLRWCPTIQWRWGQDCWMIPSSPLTNSGDCLWQTHLHRGERCHVGE